MSRVELLASYWTICGGAEPHTDHEWSPFGLRERAEAASKAGFTGLGIWHADLLHLRERHGLAEMRRILADNGIRHLELEFLTDWFLSPGERRTASDQLRQSLLEAAWDAGYEQRSNVVEVYVRYLRQKIGVREIETVRGVGYRLVAPAA